MKPLDIKGEIKDNQIRIKSHLEFFDETTLSRMLKEELSDTKGEYCYKDLLNNVYEKYYFPFLSTKENVYDINRNFFFRDAKKAYIHEYEFKKGEVPDEYQLIKYIWLEMAEDFVSFIIEVSIFLRNNALVFRNKELDEEMLKYLEFANENYYEMLYQKINLLFVNSDNDDITWF